MYAAKATAVYIHASVLRELGMTPEHYVCACGPDSVPGNALFQALPMT